MNNDDLLKLAAALIIKRAANTTQTPSSGFDFLGSILKTLGQPAGGNNQRAGSSSESPWWVSAISNLPNIIKAIRGFRSNSNAQGPGPGYVPLSADEMRRRGIGWYAR